MKKLALLVVVLVAWFTPAAASASCTWSSTGTYSSKVVCTTANESDPSGATEGMSLADLNGFVVVANASGGTFTASPAGTLAIFLWDDTFGVWARCYDCANGGELTMPTGAASQSWAAFQALLVASRRGRIAIVPKSVTTSAGGVTIYLNGTSWR